ncbi:Lysine--tRNA ligase [bacterium HR34]|nr:Lysine--tRNA ligase [bacterium HR34]
MEEDVKKDKLKKVENLRKLGINPYPVEVGDLIRIREVLDNFEEYEKKGEKIKIAGRILSRRWHGKIIFLTIDDNTDEIQVVLREDILGEENYNLFLDNIEKDDIVEFLGEVMITKRGQKSLLASSWRILTKAILPIPDRWYGLKDVEERYRKRYLDLLLNREVKENFILRSKIIKEIRKYLDEQGFIEVETPVLQPIYGGASARPFITDLFVLKMKLYLRISPELYLKRLIVGGFDKVYELGRVFRNEGIDRTHNPEFTSLEFYIAYCDYKKLMDFTEQFIREVVKRSIGRTKIIYEDKEIDFEKKWERLDYCELFEKEVGLHPLRADISQLREKAKELGVEIKKEDTEIEIIDELFKEVCLPKLQNPTFLINHPKGTFPLAKSRDDNGEYLASFQVFAGGMQLITAFSELNDPIEQEERLKEQEKIFKKGLDIAHRLDEDFIEALSYGMPPTAGFGLGIDRFVSLLTNSHAIKDVILFPFLRPRN